ncbi:MAG: glycosyltransferase [Flavonifractor plautii]
MLHQANAGVSAARNAALERATGQYLQFVDGDDYLPPPPLPSGWSAPPGPPGPIW